VPDKVYRAVGVPQGRFWVCSSPKELGLRVDHRAKRMD
jgi:hypothetical protein